MKFSPDGKYLATAGEDGVIYVWKVRSVTRKEWKEKMDMRVFEDDPVHEYVGHTVSLSLFFSLVPHRGPGMVEERLSHLGLSGLLGASVAPQRPWMSVCVQAQVRLWGVAESKRHGDVGGFLPRGGVLLHLGLHGQEAAHLVHSPGLRAEVGAGTVDHHHCHVLSRRPSLRCRTLRRTGDLLLLRRTSLLHADGVSQQAGEG